MPFIIQDKVKIKNNNTVPYIPVYLKPGMTMWHSSD